MLDERQAMTAPVLPSTLIAPEHLRHWYALYVIKNHEKRVEDRLRTKNLEVFLPQYNSVRQWRNKTTPNLQLPLFPGYVFARIASTERIRVLEDPSVVYIISNGRELLPLPDAEIETLRNGLHLRQVDPYPYLKVGIRARIRSGPLGGLEGVIIRRDQRLRIVLSMDLIAHSMAVQVEADELEYCE